MADNASDPQQGQVNESGRPETGGGEGRVEKVGRTPDNVRVDPNITEGHPGYQESGDSELTPPPAGGDQGKG
jgi:hypothetical protein